MMRQSIYDKTNEQDLHTFRPEQSDEVTSFAQQRHGADPKQKLDFKKLNMVDQDYQACQDKVD